MAAQGLRNRKKNARNGKSSDGTSQSKEVEAVDSPWHALNYVNIAVGVIVMIITARWYTQFCGTLIENSLWFSNIGELEREISFRTENGLYYSYYKQMVQAKSISEGLHELVHDKRTEHPNTINLLARMNIYQEVALAVIYRSFSFIQSAVEPVYFYLNSVFNLHGLLVAVLYLTSWLLSGSWLAGALSAALYIANKEDTTRVAFVTPLRESFALPFFWCQILAISCYFRPNTTPLKERVCRAAILASTFLFAVTWQFNQFLLLMQSMALFGVQVLQLVPHRKIRVVYVCQLVSLLAVCLLQYANTIILTGPLFAFVPAALLLMHLQGERPSPGGVLVKAVKVLLYVLAVFGLAAVFGLVSKTVCREEGDAHIFDFVMAKFGLVKASRNFDVQLYLCNDAFQFLSLEVIQRLSKLLAFPLYAAVHGCLLLGLLAAVLASWGNENKAARAKKTDEEEEAPSTHMFENRPELAYHTIQVVFYGCLALTTLRMKYLWTPYMCILAGLVGDRAAWGWLLAKLGNRDDKLVVLVQNLIPVGFLGLLAYLYLPGYWTEMENLREFWDPDTVELMKWIKASSPAGAAFAGSMQLMAGVKLCTGRHINNHPHFEDKALRQRTRDVYQMYSRQEPDFVHAIFSKLDTSYIIVEESQCLGRRTSCSIQTILDLANGQIPEMDDVEDKAGLVATSTPRFCKEENFQKQSFKKYFKWVFQNKTFRIYKVL